MLDAKALYNTFNLVFSSLVDYWNAEMQPYSSLKKKKTWALAGISQSSVYLNFCLDKIDDSLH